MLTQNKRLDAIPGAELSRLDGLSPLRRSGRVCGHFRRSFRPHGLLTLGSLRLRRTSSSRWHGFSRGRRAAGERQSGPSAHDLIADIQRRRHNSSMDKIDASTLEQLPLTDISSVMFYKRDEITTDLICCDVALNGGVRTFHEELGGWGLLLEHLATLPGFRTDWFAEVSQPPFAEASTVAFSRV